MTTATMTLLDYLQDIGGRDLLIFDTDAEATAAVRRLRAEHAGLPVRITASYNKVTIEQV